mmetsp:Transcript_38921/g.70223  ORF Transcript_38921/g.70223 Transcript_38921/m.70223 type:complete len:154 (+) Transcript_38921:28-489(+)
MDDDMDDEMRRLLEGFEAHQRDNQEGKKKESAEPPKQLSEAQSQALLSELNHAQREELCQVLKAQSEGKTDIRLSPELARILQRFQRRVGLGPNGWCYRDSSQETWPMYLGVVLFIVMIIVFTYVYFQEQVEIELEEREKEEDAYWLLREFGF